MSDPWSDLGEAYEKGISDAGASLSPKDRELYLIYEFIVEHLQGGWFYNWSYSLEKFAETAAALRSRGLHRLAPLVEEAGVVMRRIEILEIEMKDEWKDVTWGQICERIDPQGRLDEIWKEIAAIPDFDLPSEW